MNYLGVQPHGPVHSQFRCPLGVSKEQLGFESICIFERDQSLNSREQGYSLTIQEN